MGAMRRRGSEHGQKRSGPVAESDEAWRARRAVISRGLDSVRAARQCRDAARSLRAAEDPRAMGDAFGRLLLAVDALRPEELMEALTEAERAK